MHLFQRAVDLQNWLQKERSAHRSIGFVPTMGALHEGHLSLIRQARAENQVTVGSIFVNPTQFNQASDLQQYPRTPAKDIDLLHGVGCDALFLPSEAEIYPPGLNTQVTLDLAGLDAGMEGAHRPGHFAGVVQVVKRLLDIVQPHHLYLGQKDYQQYCVVRRMIDVLHLPVSLHMGATVREPDGLAMSSRNVRLSPEARAQAPLIYQTLSQLAAKLAAGFTPAQAQQWGLTQLATSTLRPEYLLVVDGHSLAPLHDLADADLAVACTAVWAGEVRLIDNIVLKGKT